MDTQADQFQSQQLEQSEPSQINQEEVIERFNMYMNGPAVVIQVCDPMTKGSGFDKHTVYCVKGEDKEGSFDVYRRYNDFFALRDSLVQKWPGCMIPPIPDKQLAQGNDQQVVQERKRQLDYFMRSLAKIGYLYYSQDVNQLFLRSQGSDIGKSIQSQPKATTQEILTKFKGLFPGCEQKDSNGQYVAIIGTTSGALKKNLVALKSQADQANALSQARRILNEQKHQLFLTILPEYESKCQLEYASGNESKLIIANPNNITLNDQIQQMRESFRQNPLDMIYDLMKIEQRECEAMLAAINQRDILMQTRSKLEAKVREDQSSLSNLAQGKKTLTTITASVTSKNSNDAQAKLELKIAENQKEVDFIGQLIDVITVVLATVEIPKYKSTRINHYRETFKTVQNLESQVCQAEQGVYESLYSLASHLL